MKPTKNRIYCKDCNRPKMLFETEKKANTFIKFNGNEIELSSGVIPVRSYYCVYCNGWHVTSKKNVVGIKSVTENIIDAFNLDQENMLIEKRRTNKIKNGKNKNH